MSVGSDEGRQDGRGGDSNHEYKFLTQEKIEISNRMDMSVHQYEISNLNVYCEACSRDMVT